jgi:hypothetical protein
MGIYSTLATAIADRARSVCGSVPRRVLNDASFDTHYVIDASAIVRVEYSRVTNAFSLMTSDRPQLHVAVMRQMWDWVQERVRMTAGEQNETRIIVWWMWDNANSDHWMKKATRESRDALQKSFLTEQDYYWDMQRDRLVYKRGTGDDELAHLTSEQQRVILGEILKVRSIRNDFVASMKKVFRETKPPSYLTHWYQPRGLEGTQLPAVSINPATRIVVVDGQMKTVPLPNAKHPPQQYVRVAPMPYVEADTAIQDVARQLCFGYNREKEFVFADMSDRDERLAEYEQQYQKGELGWFVCPPPEARSSQPQMTLTPVKSVPRANLDASVTPSSTNTVASFPSLERASKQSTPSSSTTHTYLADVLKIIDGDDYGVRPTARAGDSMRRSRGRGWSSKNSTPSSSSTHTYLSDVLKIIDGEDENAKRGAQEKDPIAMLEKEVKRIRHEAPNRVFLVSTDSDQFPITTLQHRHVYGKPWNSRVDVFVMRLTTHPVVASSKVLDAVIKSFFANSRPDGAFAFTFDEEHIVRFFIACGVLGTDFTDKTRYTHDSITNDVLSRVQAIPTHQLAALAHTQWPRRVSPGRAWNQLLFCSAVSDIVQDGGFTRTKPDNRDIAREVKSFQTATYFMRSNAQTRNNSDILSLCALFYYWSTLMPPAEIEND